MNSTILNVVLGVASITMIAGCYSDTKINPSDTKADIRTADRFCTGDFLFITTKDGKEHRMTPCTVTDSYIESCNTAAFTFLPKEFDRVQRADITSLTVRRAASCLLK